MILCHMGLAGSCHAGCYGRIAAADGTVAGVVVADKVVKEVHFAIGLLRMDLGSSVEAAESLELNHLPCVQQERLVDVYSLRYSIVR